MTIIMNLPLLQSNPRLKQLCARHGISRLAVFGSAARGEARSDSDVDLLVEFSPGQTPSLLGFSRLKRELAEFFSVSRVDLATPSILRNPYRRRAILADIKELYAA